MTHQTLARMLLESSAQHADLVALRVRRDTRWECVTYAQFADRIGKLAAALIGSGLRRGDRVALFAPNCPEWTLFDAACLRAGLVSVPIYATSSPAQAAHIIGDSGARLVVCGDAHILDVTRGAVAACPEVEHLVLLQGVPQATTRVGTEVDAERAADGPATVALTEFEDRGDPVAVAAELDEALVQGAPDDLVTIVYTSGTTGAPKGVMLTNRTFAHQVMCIDTLFNLRAGQRNMCFLPLSHAYERAWSYVVLTRGLENCYVLDAKEVAAAMLDIRPDTFVSVPRLYEKVYDTAHAQAGTGVRRTIFDSAIRTGSLFQRRLAEGRPVGRALRARHAVADRLVLHKVRDAVGGPKNVMAAGGAALRQEVEEFFYAAGLTVYQGYGLTETSPLVSCNAPGRLRFGTVGKPVPGVQVRIAAENGEILVRGDNVMTGYFGNEQATAEVIDDDGWFHTGDVGHIVGDGYLVITDRIKDLIVTAQGKNIAPGPIENALAAHRLVEAAVVVGDGRRYLTALIQPAFEDLEEHARSQSWSVSTRQELVAKPEVNRLYCDIVDEVGADVSPQERIQKLSLLDVELTMDDGDLTPTLKVRRRRVEHRFRHLIEAMYA